MKLEQQLLPHNDLAPLYDKAVWFYNYQTFQDDEAGRAADDVAIRFGVSSWPQLMLVHPSSFERRASVGRSAKAFHDAFGRAALPGLLA